MDIPKGGHRSVQAIILTFSLSSLLIRPTINTIIVIIYINYLVEPVQFSADVYNHYDMKQRSLFIAPLVVIYCREFDHHHRPQGATANKGHHHRK